MTMWLMTWSIQSSMWWSLVGVTGTSVKDAVKKKKLSLVVHGPSHANFRYQTDL